VAQKDIRDLDDKTGCHRVDMKTKKCRTNWLGQELRISQEYIHYKALSWGKVSRGAEHRWRKVETELRGMDLTWGKVGRMANDRDRWQKLVATKLSE